MSVWAKALKSRSLPFDVRTGTSERRAAIAGTDRPDLALYDSGDFVAVFGEVKLPDVEIKDMARTTEQNDQIGRYLAQTGVVLLCNVRSVGLLACKRGYVRDLATAVSPDNRELLEVVDLWASETALNKGQAVSAEALEVLADLLEQAVTEFAPIADPAPLLRILAIGRDLHAAVLSQPGHRCGCSGAGRFEIRTT